LIKVLIAEKLSPKVIEHLKEIPEFDIFENNQESAEDFKKSIKNIDAIIIGNETILSKEALKESNNLKIIVKLGTGLENIDVEYAQANHIEIRNTLFSISISVAEYTLALMLSICRCIGPVYKSIKELNWDNSHFSRGIELFGKTAGIIGFGRIGKEIAKRELAMGMKVIYHDIIEIKTDIDAEQVPLSELLTKSDFISIHIPLTELTQNLISTNEFDLMKKNAVLINISPRGVLDEKALIQALDTDQIKAVAIDVFQKDSEERMELIKNKKVYPAPLLGAYTVEGRERAGFDVISILKDFFNV
jgi:D-3-phosphoglycerate dehydrogenase